MWFKDKPIIALAPMADYTDSPFCSICREVSGDDFVVFREMVSSEALIRKNEKTINMCRFDKSERPIVIQIFGSKPDVISKAVSFVSNKFSPDGIDINMGCPVPKIVGKVCAGAALLKEPERAVAIVERIKKNNPKVVLSVKTRLGWNDKNDILSFAPKLQSAGVQLLTIHGRTKKEGYSGEADWNQIAKVKESIDIPVIANGDIKDREDLEKCLTITKADGVMVGRGVLGNPWFFSNAVPTNDERKRVILRHALYYLKHYKTESLVAFRKNLLYYFKGRKGNKQIRQQLVKVINYSELEEILDSIL